MTPEQLTALTTELQTDPRAYGYAASVASGSDQTLADQLKLPRDGTNGGPAITIRRADIPSREIWEAIELSDWTALGANPNAAQLSTERRQLAYLSGIAAIQQPMRVLNADGSNAPLAVNLLAMFPAGSGTRTRLIALANRIGSRAEELFGQGVVVTKEDIALALRS